jgi:hypothetical protein
MLSDIKKDSAVNVMIDSKDDPNNFVTVDVADFQHLTQISGNTTDVLTCLDCTTHTINILLKMTSLAGLENLNSPLCTSGEDTRLALEMKLDEIAYLRKNAEAVAIKIQSARLLVR